MMTLTYHIIIITNFITISFKILKKSTIILACSPILPIVIPKAMKNPMRPVERILPSDSFMKLFLKL